MIKKLSRGHVSIEFEGKTSTIQGEAYLRGHGSPDFVIYENSFSSWDPPHHQDQIDANTKQRVLAALLAEFQKRGMSAIVE